LPGILGLPLYQKWCREGDLEVTNEAGGAHPKPPSVLIRKAPFR
jgi:hypothetical protein